MLKSSDEWQTPQDLFDEYNNKYNFTIDACATEQNKKCDKYMLDALDINSWTKGESIFMNPPYSNPKPFIRVAWDASKQCSVVCLVKGDFSTQWWGIFWDYEKNSPKPGCTVRFLPKRLKYTRPNGIKSGAANFPSAVVIMNRRGHE